MKDFLLPHLICPACLPKEYPLAVAAAKSDRGDISDGSLSCPKCRKKFPIRDGIALVVTEPDAIQSGGQLRYEEKGVLNTYLWSQFADIGGDAEASDAYRSWSAVIPTGEFSLDVGCAVGRMTFEATAGGGAAVGCDLSLSFIRAARALAYTRRVTFSLPFEGNLTQDFNIELPEEWKTDCVEFIVADAQRLPFRRETFDRISSLNLLDRVRYPLAHLFEINRAARTSGATLLVSSPYSWSTANTPEDAWLGGTTTGRYSGSGHENLRTLLGGRDDILKPVWYIAAEGSVWWKLRSHRNHFELIRSEYVVAKR